MDEIVTRAMAKWPDVPAVYGWLALDSRGQWLIKGERIGNPGIVEFIGRNFEHDAQGRWFFQNGPQRVYVELEATPYIWRLQADARGSLAVTAHTGQAAQAKACLLDEHGRVYLETDCGFGLVHTQDVPLLADAVESGLWVPETVQAVVLPTRYGYVLSPRNRPSAAAALQPDR